MAEVQQLVISVEQQTTPITPVPSVIPVGTTARIFAADQLNQV